MRVMDGPHRRQSAEKYHMAVELERDEVKDIRSVLDAYEGGQRALPSSTENVLRQMIKNIDLYPKSEEMKIQHFTNTKGVVICDPSIPNEELSDNAPICRKCHDMIRQPGWGY